MATFGDVVRGRNARRTVMVDVPGMEPVAVDLTPLDVERGSVTTAPADGEERLRHLAAILASSVRESARHEVDEQAILQGLDRDHLEALADAQRRWQEEVAPLPRHHETAAAYCKRLEHALGLSSPILLPFLRFAARQAGDPGSYYRTPIPTLTPLQIVAWALLAGKHEELESECARYDEERTKAPRASATKES